MIGSWTPQSVVAQISTRPEGFRWVALQAEELQWTDEAAVISECHAQGLKCGVWEAAVDYGTPAHTAQGFDFYIGQVEGSGQYDRLRSSLAAFRAAHPTLPAACVTNTGGFEGDATGTPAEKAKPFVDAGFACIAEVHIAEEGGVDHTETRLAYIENVMDWPAPQPMAGLGMGATLNDYVTVRDHAGWSVFGAEQLL